jgi:hypothetical protein
MTITVDKASRTSAEGTAEYEGQRFRWMAYRPTQSTVRIMLADNEWNWIPREQPHPLRSQIMPIARQEMTKK